MIKYLVIYWVYTLIALSNIYYYVSVLVYYIVNSRIIVQLI